LEKRRGVQFLADYGFKDLQLTIICLNSSKFTARDVKILEAFYINELNSSLNSQKYVYLPPEPLESVLPFINVSNRDTAVRSTCFYLWMLPHRFKKSFIRF